MSQRHEAEGIRLATQGAIKKQRLGDRNEMAKEKRRNLSPLALRLEPCA
jgi:hypothetical protein